MKNCLTQREFVNLLAAKGYTKKDTRQIVDDFITTVMECLAEGYGVSFHGFGMFDIIELKDRESIDMRSQQRILIPGRKIPKFVAGTSLKRAVREGHLEKDD